MMIKKLSFIGILLIFTLLISCNKKEPKNDLEKAGLKGKVKSLTLKTGYLGNNEMNILEIHKYNISGYEIEEEDFYNGEHKVKYTRDNKNNKIEEKGHGINVEGYIDDWMIKYKYNDQNKLIESTQFSENKIFKINEFKYDDNGNIISDKTSFPEEDNNEDITSYKYDENKNIVEMIEKKTGIKKVFKYDNNNNKVYEREIDENGETGISKEFKYDDNKNVIEEKYTFNYGKPFITKYYYNDNKLIEEKRFNKKGSLEWITSYEYDNKGNWIKKIFNQTNGSISVSVRLIEYYSDNEKITPETNITAPVKHDIEESINNEPKQYFEGQPLKAGEKIIKIQWGKENTTNLNMDIYNSEKGKRYCSDNIIVPIGKKWVLLYILQEYHRKNGVHVWGKPYLYINDDEEKGIYKDRYYDYKVNINLLKAKDENLKYYSGTKIKAVAVVRDDKNDYLDYIGEMWFLEVSE